jgi:hypothetical protein
MAKTKEYGGSKVPITHDDGPTARKHRPIREYAEDYDSPGFLTEKNLIAIGQVFRGQGRYVPWFYMERAPDAYDEQSSIMGWKISDEERKIWPELVGKKGLCIRTTSPKEDGRTGFEEVIRQGESWVLVNEKVVMPPVEEFHTKKKRKA